MTENKIEITAYRDLKNKVSRESSSSLREALKSYKGNILFQYKYCPDLTSNPNAELAAKAVIAAENQHRGEDFYQRLAGNLDQVNDATIQELVDEYELNSEEFYTDLSSSKTTNRLRQDIEDSKQSGLMVFPGLTIDGAPYNGAWDNHSLFSAIDKRGGKNVQLAIDSFFHWGASAAAVLIIATVLALLIVNIGFRDIYEFLRHIELGLSLGSLDFKLPLEVWINDFFMAIFFLLVGLEIKKEVLDGELSDAKKAAMPVIGAIGGMLVPALIYIGLNAGTDTAVGWGIPMATDIAFTLGLMALLGSKVPISLKIFISALAIADDLGAILVIALFYGHGFHLIPFLLALVVIGIMVVLNRRKIYAIPVYVVLGTILWFFVFQSGLHATLAGVITAILIPARRSADLPLIARQIAIIFDREIMKNNSTDQDPPKIGHGSLVLLRNTMERLREPSDYLMHSLEKVVNFSILPLFAFFNTGILISSGSLDLLSPVSLGIILGLVIGKPLGITGFCWLASKFNIASLSPEISWKKLIGASTLAGVGFTMSIVVASSAFHNETLTSSKISILLASTMAAVLGIVILNLVSKNDQQSAS